MFEIFDDVIDVGDKCWMILTAVVDGRFVSNIQYFNLKIPKNSFIMNIRSVTAKMSPTSQVVNDITVATNNIKPS